MLPHRRVAGRTLVAGLLLTVIAACGDTVTIPQAASATPFSTASIAVTQMGNASVAIDTTSVKFALDDTRSLVGHLSLTSRASTPVTVSIRASLYDPSHKLIGDAVGGQINVQPGQSTAAQLSGPTPLGTIASAVIEVSTQPSPA